MSEKLKTPVGLSCPKTLIQFLQQLAAKATSFIVSKLTFPWVFFLVILIAVKISSSIFRRKCSRNTAAVGYNNRRKKITEDHYARNNNTVTYSPSGAADKK